MGFSFTHIRIVRYVVVRDLNVLLNIGDYLVQLLLDTFLLNLLTVLLVARLKIGENGNNRRVFLAHTRSLILDKLLPTNDDGLI